MTVSRTKALRLLAALLAAVTLLLCGCGAAVSPPTETPAPSAGPAPTLEPRPIRGEDENVKVYLDGLLADRGCVRDGTVYLDPTLLCGELGLSLESSADEAGFRLEIGSLTVTGETGQEYIRAGERYLYVPEGWIISEGRVRLPAETLGRLFQTEVKVSGEPLRAEISTRGARLMEGGGEFYLRNHTDEEIFWLAHIISAEAGNQPLAGQIGVGNVVLNRVADERYPDTILEVIFQRGERTQFDPVDDGNINRRSHEISLIAAYLCLEGYNTVGPSEFFVNPDIGNATWFEASRTFVIRIGDHDFYA